MDKRVGTLCMYRGIRSFVDHYHVQQLGDLVGEHAMVLIIGYQHRSLHCPARLNRIGSTMDITVCSTTSKKVDGRTQVESIPVAPSTIVM